jgi:hypothetical protein
MGPVHLDEIALGQLLVSPYREQTVRAVFETIAQGRRCYVLRTDGSTETLDSPGAASAFLREHFGWVAGGPKPIHRRKMQSVS